MDVHLYHDTLTLLIEASEEGCAEDLWPTFLWVSLDIRFELRSQIGTVCLR